MDTHETPADIQQEQIAAKVAASIANRPEILDDLIRSLQEEAVVWPASSNR